MATSRSGRLVADLGGDDHAGANYTGQPAVNSYHREDRH
jgi:hypothetical protein